jgi:hypothetical protein
MKLIYEQNAFLMDFVKLLTWCEVKGWMLTGGELWRTEEQQRAYLAAGKTKTMQSNHLRRLAIDLNFFMNDVLVTDKAHLQEIGDYWESLSPENRWGGNFRSLLDCPHFERNAV